MHTVLTKFVTTANPATPQYPMSLSCCSFVLRLKTNREPRPPKPNRTRSSMYVVAKVTSDFGPIGKAGKPKILNVGEPNCARTVFPSLSCAFDCSNVPLNFTSPGIQPNNSNATLFSTKFGSTKFCSNPSVLKMSLPSLDRNAPPAGAPSCFDPAFVYATS